MRAPKVLVLLASLALLPATPAAARERSWCALSDGGRAILHREARTRFSLVIHRERTHDWSKILIRHDGRLDIVTKGGGGKRRLVADLFGELGDGRAQGEPCKRTYDFSPAALR